MLLPIAGLLLALLATEATAGAWPRPKGETFVSVATRQSTGARTLIAAVQDIRSYNSIYVEHGVTDRLHRRPRCRPGPRA